MVLNYMKFKLISVGKIKETFVLEGFNEFAKRIKLEHTVLKDSNPEKESKLILSKVKEFVCLSEEGVEMTSVEFSKFLDVNMTFVIGGPDGLSDEVKKKASKVISLSKMTFTHDMARLFFVEQLYRAVSIKEGKKYHR